MGGAPLGDEDRWFKQLFEAFFGDLLSLMVPKLAPRLDAKRAEFLRSELFADAPETRRREVDLLAKVPTDRGEEELVLVHVEVEGQARSSMGRRLWHYAMLIRSRHELPLIPMVVYLRGGPAGVNKEIHREHVLGEEMVRFHYFSFGLSGSSADEHLERTEPLAWALSSLMREENLRRGRHKMEALRRIVRADVSPNRKHLLARCVEYYLELDSHERKEFEDMLAQRENEDVRSFEDHWIHRMERAAEREGMRQLLLLQLERRFGSVPEATRRQVKSLDSIDELTRLADRILAADSLEELGLDG